MRKGQNATEETKKRMSEARLGKKLSAYQRSRMSEGQKGRKFTDEHKQKLSKSHIGLNTWIKGKKMSIETRKKISEALKGEKCYWWKGGVSKESKIIRKGLEYKLWRTAVFTRDNHTCVFCGIKSQKGVKVILNADHIKPFAYYPELRFAIDNGRTLCEPCHKTTDTYMVKAKKFKK